MVEVPLFPLRLVLFNGSLYELDIFEPRYLNMVNRALANETGIGVVYLTRGSDVHKNEDDPVEFSKIGTLSSIVHTEIMDESRMFIVVEGGAKFRVHSSWIEDDHLNVGLVNFLREDMNRRIRTKDEELAQLFDHLNKFRDTEGHPTMEIEPDNASMLSFRLAEMLPMGMELRQKLLELDDPYHRLDTIQRWVQTERMRG